MIRRRALLAGAAGSATLGMAPAEVIGLWRGVPPPSLDLNFLVTGATLDSRITFTRSAGPATYFDSTGALQTAGTNVPRFDYDPATLQARGLLIEETRTNLLLNSTALGTQSVSVTAQAYTLSFYGTGTITLSGVSTAGPLVGAGANNRVQLTFTPTAGTLTCAVSGTVTNANLEAGAFATSYITTAGSTATRPQDLAAMPTTGWFLAAGPGSIAFAGIQEGVTSNRVPAAINDGSGNNEFRVLVNALGSLQAAISASSVTIGGTIVSAPNTIAPFMRVGGATAWTSQTFTLACDGAFGAESAVTAALPAVTTLQIGARTPGVFPLCGWLRRIRYWPRMLDNMQLAQASVPS